MNLKTKVDSGKITAMSLLLFFSSKSGLTLS